ncbi:MAG TPA: adenosylhomocysteinase [Limnochordia bacterium]|nr:adenosylhomocysteinase [Limnochordia bacterium]
MSTGDFKDPKLAEAGRRRIEWADGGMPVLRGVRSEWERTKPLAGVRIAGCLHITTETANLARALAAGGAELALCASNPLSTQDDVAAALNLEYGIAAFAVRGEDADTYYRHIRSVLDIGPQLTMDDGADLVNTLHKERHDLLDGIEGGTEETTTGVIRLRAMAGDGVLRFPVVAVNDAMTKHLFDNRYGVGQSTLDGLVRATNVLIAGSTFVVCGYGWCGRGLAARARGLGANVVVTETDPLHALEAVMEGFRVMPLDEAAPLGDIFVSVTGNRHVIDRRHFERMKDGALVANAGHFDIELNLEGLRDLSRSEREVRTHVREFTLTNGRRIRLLAEGRLVNLGAAEGHPAQVMDMSFANQALSALWLHEQKGQLAPGVYTVPEAIDRGIAERKLAAMGVGIDRLTPEQERYLHSYDVGT